MYMDFRKAFDSVDHKILLDKLNFYGVRGIPFLWFKSYLGDRKQFVNVNGVNSDTIFLTHSVPQGSNLGPLLFLIYINDLPNCSNFFKYTFFADDCTISCPVQRGDLKNVHHTINIHLEHIFNWISANRIKLNVDKTKYMIFSYRDHFRLTGPVVIGREVVSQTTCVRFLGINLDCKLNFSDHVTHIARKISHSLGVFLKLRDCFPLNILRFLYFAMIYPYIQYAIEVWYGAPNYVKQKIVVLQKRAIRIMNFLNFNDHTSLYFCNMKLLPVEYVYNLNIATYMYKTLNVQNYDIHLLGRLITHNDVHDHNTRDRFSFVTPRFNRVSFKSSICYAGVQIWNSLPDNVKNITSIKPFRRHIKDMLFSQLE